MSGESRFGAACFVFCDRMLFGRLVEVLVDGGKERFRLVKILSRNRFFKFFYSVAIQPFPAVVQRLFSL